MISLVCLAVLKVIGMVVLSIIWIVVLLIFPMELRYALREEDKSGINLIFIGFLGVVCLVELIGIVYFISIFMGY